MRIRDLLLLAETALGHPDTPIEASQFDEYQPRDFVTADES